MYVNENMITEYIPLHAWQGHSCAMNIHYTFCTHTATWHGECILMFHPPFILRFYFKPSSSSDTHTQTWQVWLAIISAYPPVNLTLAIESLLL